MDSTQPQVLRIPRTDDPSGYVLVHVSRPDAAVLDVKLVATEGESPYVGVVKQTRLKHLRSKGYHGSDDEWMHVVGYALGQGLPPTGQADWVSDLEVVALIRNAANEDQEMIITLRKRIDSITQRLGSITLTQNDDEAIQLFEWTGLAVSKVHRTQQQIASLTSKLRAAEDTIGKLSDQLKDIIEAKAAHDDQLMANFALLLNEKKLKIRNQQRLLASAKVDPRMGTSWPGCSAGGTLTVPSFINVDLDTASELKTADSDRETSIRAKRTSKHRIRSEPEDSNADEGFERMDVDQVMNQHDNDTDNLADSERQETPQPLEDQTETGDETDNMEPDLYTKTSNGMAGRRETETRSMMSRPKLTAPASPPRMEHPPFTKKAAADDHVRPPSNGESRLMTEHSDDMDGDTNDDEL